MLRSIVVQAAAADQIPEVQNGIRDLLRQRHRIQQGADEDFILRNQQEIAETQTAAMDTMTALLAGVAICINSNWVRTVKSGSALLWRSRRRLLMPSWTWLMEF